MAHKRSNLDLLITSATLHQIQHFHGSTDLTDTILENRGVPDHVVKNVCAKVSSELAERIDNVCNVLNISKRRFLEAAFIEACQQAEEIMDDEGLWEAMQPFQSVTDEGN